MFVKNHMKNKPLAEKPGNDDRPTEIKKNRRIEQKLVSGKKVQVGGKTISPTWLEFVKVESLHVRYWSGKNAAKKA